MFALRRPHLTFVPPRLARDDEDDAPEWEREEVGEVHFRPLYWSQDVPRLTRAANFYVRRPGEHEYILVRVQPQDDYNRGLEWFGPLPEPPGPVERRR